MTAAIVLGAGASTRLGQPKQLVLLGGETLLERAVRTARDAGLSPAIAVVHDAALIQPLQTLGAQVLLNRQYFKGISTSIKVGVRWAKGLAATGVVLMTCDQPAVTPEHLRNLCAMPDTATGSSYAGRIGVPAYFPAACFDELMKLQGDTGARELLLQARIVTFEALALDVDTEEDLKRARGLYG